MGGRGEGGRGDGEGGNLRPYWEKDEDEEGNMWMKEGKGRGRGGREEGGREGVGHVPACVVCLLSKSPLFLFFVVLFSFLKKRKRNPHSCSWSHSALAATLQVSDPQPHPPLKRLLLVTSGDPADPWEAWLMAGLSIKFRVTNRLALFCHVS